MNHRERISPGISAPAEERRCSWLNPWVFLVSVLVIKTAFITICLVALIHGSYGQYKTLLQNGTEWHCTPNISAEESWTCCPKGWRRFQEKCYYLSNDLMSWAESEQNCTGMGSHLVVINSKAEQEFLSNLTKRVSTKAYETKFLIGLTANKYGQWQWVDQTPYTETATFWKPGEPNLLFVEKCAAIHIKGKTDSSTYRNWNNIPCLIKCYRICELAVKIV
ncbi:C-type lectin domain family 4 member E isoform X1 [Calypte anna]|uniref:C-type lectin domain family 4 member E isoform X1 n=2 Tax=Calypte anna TaxID=9244 RepID=UPI0011C3ABA0|nr:C-type lectin domain family 4 member E isoform X1 [Calypte anna]